MLNGLLEKIIRQSRRSSDLSGEGLGDFCTPRQEEWDWNVEPIRTDNDRISSIRAWDRYSRGIPAACMQEEEVDLNAAEQFGIGLHRVCHVDSRTNLGSIRRSSQTHVAMRYQTLQGSKRGLPDCSFRDPFRQSVDTGPQAADGVPLEYGINRANHDRTALPSSQFTAVDRSRACSGSSIPLSAREEQIFFDLVRKTLHFTQQGISNEALRSRDRTTDECDCTSCLSWRYPKWTVWRIARKGSLLKARLLLALMGDSVWRNRPPAYV